MAKRKRTPKASQHVWRLEGDPGSTKLERGFPTDDGGVALSWATGALLFREGDNRPGEELPCGDYLLSLVGPLQTEPLYKLRKHERHEKTDPLVSWCAA